VSFSVQNGEVFGLLGPNGAGKSTLIRMLTTLIEPTEGRGLIGGCDIKEQANDVRQLIGVIPQAMTSDPDLTCEENLMIHAKLYRVPAQRRAAAVTELLEAVSLSEWRNVPAKNLSGGMRRRLEIARGLIHQPKIFFLDEPTTGLDPNSRMGVWEMISKLRTERGLTILLTTHYMDEADRLCDRIAIVDHGKLVVLDTPTALKASVPGASVIEARFHPDPAGWTGELQKLPDVERVAAEGSGVYRVFSDNGTATAEALLDLVRKRGIELSSFAVQSTTLDDVFLHFTGRALRDTVQSAHYDVSFMYNR
jgi:ABC-2 type transport system ATP-binding protein